MYNYYYYVRRYRASPHSRLWGLNQDLRPTGRSLSTWLDIIVVTLLQSFGLFYFDVYSLNLFLLALQNQLND